MARALRRSTARVDDTQPDHTEEQEAPRRGRRGSAPEPEAEETPRGRRGRKPAAEEEAPEPDVAEGWDGYDENRQDYEDFLPEFTKTLVAAQEEDREALFKFVDEGPFAVYKQHWITRDGKRSFNCIANKALGRRCPICEAGDRPGVKVSFNVISLDDPDAPRVEIWTVGQKVADMIKKMSQDKKTGPLNREDLYFAARRSGNGKKGGTVQTNISAVKERDLQADWDTPPLTATELDEFDETAFDKSDIEYLKVSALDEIADEMSRR